MGSDLLLELEPIVAANLDRHLALAVDWMPHEYVPWARGRDFVEQPWSPGDSVLSPAARVAFEVNLLTEDNLPSYHHEIAVRFGRSGAWGEWIGRWTAEEGRHAACMRDYLLTTRGLDPQMLETRRMAAVQAGYHSGQKSTVESMAYVSFQELATRISHRNTGRYIDDPLADRLLSRVAADENLHMIFYRALVAASLEISPSETVRAICRQVHEFEMPGTMIPGFRAKAMTIARSGIYDLRIHHDDVVWPLLRHWRLMELESLDGDADRAREELAAFLRKLDVAAERQRDRFAAVPVAGTA